MLDEQELAISPIVQESVQHNKRSFSNIRNLTASLFGVAAGTLGLESYPGFAFYLLGSLLVSLLVFILRADGQPNRFFYSPFGDFWAGEVVGSAMSFVLTWTLFFGIVRA